SVWLKRENGENLEQDAQSIGLMAPLIGLVTIIIAIGDIISFVIGTTGIFKHYPVEDEPDRRGNHGDHGIRRMGEKGYELQPRMSLGQGRNV
ncbi:hypothetical protein NW762_014471, partial [Fusarium torreyae]